MYKTDLTPPLRRALILIALLVPLAANAAAAGPPKLQLPKTARPIRYAIELALIPSRETFSGTAEIELDLSEATRLLWLNASDLSISRASLAVRSLTLPAGVVICVRRRRGEHGLEMGRRVPPERARQDARRQNRSDSFYREPCMPRLPGN